LKGYGQYDMHGSVVNAPTNLNLVQNLLPWMLYDNSFINVFSKKRKKKKTLLYILLYIYVLNILMKTLKELCQIPLYKDAKGFIKK
jgi:hypothetical protein